jgi:hypothetical protein
MSFYFVVYFKSVCTRANISKNGVKIDGVFWKVKSPVLATVSKSERQEQMDNTIPIKTKRWEDISFYFCKIRKTHLDGNDS